MADNITLNAGSGGSAVAADDISSVFFQRVKLIHGADGVNDGDVATGNRLNVFKGHNSTVYALAFSPGGGRVVSGGLDNNVLLWGLPR